MEQYNLHLLNWILGSIVVAGVCRYSFNHFKHKARAALLERKRQLQWLADVKLQLLPSGIAYRKTDSGYLSLPITLQYLPQELYRLGFSVEEAVKHIRGLYAIVDNTEILK